MRCADAADAYIVDSDTLARTKASCIVMHPLPRNQEIQSEVDYHPRAAYFRQCVIDCSAIGELTRRAGCGTACSRGWPC